MAAEQKSGLEKLLTSSPGMEVWWDASPLVFEHWRDKFVGEQPPEVQEWLAPQVDRLFPVDDPARTLFRGVTTNPVITKKAIDTLQAEWEPWIKEEIARHPSLGPTDIMWNTYREISRQGAARFLPLFEESQYAVGYVSAQVDPRVLDDTRTMIRQAMELKALQPNIMVKVPGTGAGMLAIFLLTAMGVPTNATLVFTVPQVMAVAEAVRRGREMGAIYGTDYSRWRSVITIMMARCEERQEFVDQARECGLDLDEELMRWSGTAIMKKCYQLLKERHYPSKLLLASSRVGPRGQGEPRILHVDETVGADLVYTMNPEFIEKVLLYYAQGELESRIEKPVPGPVMEKLLEVPYFRRAYQEDGLELDEFIDHPATIFTRDEFTGAMQGFEAYVESLM